MSRGSTFYDVFTLDEHATPQQIRTAYVRLMKVHHPDKSGQQTPGLVALINLCYETLSDPAKRAAYDADLRRRNDLAAASVSPRSETKRFTSARLAIAMLLFVACLASVGAFAFSKSAGFAESPLMYPWAESVSTQPVGLPRLTRRDLIQRRVKLAKSLSPSEALVFSERCFGRAQVEQSGRALQLCIIFDDAFLYWRQTPEWNAFLPPYFDDEVVHSRHSRSLLRFETNVEGTLAQLRYEAFRALLDGVHSQEAPATDPT
ncbi:MAG TPA: J domain-containing protein [Bradyrhizobium sp.]|nr:J domain-containing protein [Bradyrhizobium sp.]